jgi:hypothetical protein
MHANRLLGYGLLALAAVVETTAVLGPLVLDLIRYHISDTTLNQVMGGDAAALVVVVPVCVAVGVLALRGHPAAPVLALAPALFAVYTYTQLIVGQEYLRLAGNAERYFPLLYAGFLLGGAVAVTAWRAVEPAALPPPSRRLDRIAAIVLLGVVLYLAGMHLPTLADALRDTPTRTEYVSSPTAFWLVKLMDLGIIAPAALAAGVGLLRQADWVRTITYAILGAYTLLGALVTGMGVTMYVNGDPDASLALTAGFAVFTLAFATLSVALCRPLFLARGHIPAPVIPPSRTPSQGGVRR